MSQHLPHVAAAQTLQIPPLQTPESVAVRNLIDHGDQPRETVGERAVEIEDDEIAPHGAGIVRAPGLRARLTRVPSARRLKVNEREFIRSGLPRRPWQDLYHSLMTVRWSSLFASFAGFYVIFNLLFAALYSLQPNDIANLDPPNYWGRFFFSVE